MKQNAFTPHHFLINGLTSSKTTKKSGAGFTILEVILAIFILSVAVFASFSLIQQTIISASLNQSKLIAYYLAQEGIENVRNIRDTNWLQGKVWNRGISSSEAIVSFLDGTTSKFKRKITISTEANKMKVSVEVSWTERGREHKVMAMAELYNWK